MDISGIFGIVLYLSHAVGVYQVHYYDNKFGRIMFIAGVLQLVCDASKVHLSTVECY